MTTSEAVADTKTKTPWHLWLVGVIAVLFNGIGVFDHTMTLVQGERYMESAGMTPAQISHYLNMPVWMQVDWPVGVWSAMLGSVLLLLRNKLAFPVFVLSLAAFLLSLAYTYLLSDGGKIMGSQMGMTSAMITAFLVFFIWYSWAMSRRGVLR